MYKGFTYTFKEVLKIIVKEYSSKIMTKIDVIYAVVFLTKSENSIFQVTSLVMETNTCSEELIRDMPCGGTILHCD